MKSISASILVALLLPACARAQRADVDAPEPRTVTVQATATAEREPDLAIVDAAVETFAEDARTAASRNAEITADVIAALRDAGVAEDRIRTVGYNVQPEYEFERTPEGRDRRLVGYRVTNTVEATVDEPDGTGPVIDAAIDAGADRIARLRFELADRAALRRVAMRRAVARAREDAEAIADAAGLRLGPLLRVTTGATSDGPPRPVMMAAPRAEAAAPTPVEPGRLEVGATVTAVYELAER